MSPVAAVAAGDKKNGLTAKAIELMIAAIMILIIGLLSVVGLWGAGTPR